MVSGLKRTFSFVMVAIVIAGCSTTHDDMPSVHAPTTTVATRFDGLQPSLDALGRRFLDALATSDRGELRSIAITKEEFERNVWPKLPASEPGSNLTPDWVWNQYAAKNEASFKILLSRYGGRKLDYAGLEFRGETRDYGDFLLHMESVLRIVDHGEEKKVRLFGSVIEEAGQYKIYGFVVD